MYNNCLIPTQQPPLTNQQQSFRNQDLSPDNIGDQATLNMERREDDPPINRYNRETRTEPKDWRTPQEWKRPAKGYFPEIDTKRTNMQR